MATMQPTLYDHARNSANSAFSHMQANDRRRSSSPTFHRGSVSPMDWQATNISPADRATTWKKMSPSPSTAATAWKTSPSPLRTPSTPIIAGDGGRPKPRGPQQKQQPRPSAAEYEKRMSASLATQLMAAAGNRRSCAAAANVEEEQQAMDPAEREVIEAELARKWAYTLGAELAHHVVGVFSDPQSYSYNRRWNSDTATRVFGSNPWSHLASQKFFVPPFVCREVVASMPKCMQDIKSAVHVASHIVSTRNEMQHVAFPEDLYMRIKQFKKDRLMRHLKPNDRELHEFLRCERFLADWFIGTPRIYRLVGQLLFNCRGALNMQEDLEWANSYKSNAHVSHFLTILLYTIAQCSSKDWYKHEWPTTTLDLAQAMDRMERIDENFGPRLEKKWRKMDSIAIPYQKCVESGLLTPAVKKFCSLPCAFLENIKNLGLSEIC